MSRPRMMPLRSTRPGSRSTSSRDRINGRTNWATRFGCALACEIIPGAKPQKAPPTNAASLDRTTCLAKNQYQAVDVAARPTVTITANDTCGPNSMVIGISGMVSPYAEVLAIMLTPSGTLSWSVQNGVCGPRSEEHTSELQSPCNLVCRLLLEKK